MKYRKHVSESKTKLHFVFIFITNVNAAKKSDTCKMKLDSSDSTLNWAHQGDRV